MRSKEAASFENMLFDKCKMTSKNHEALFLTFKIQESEKSSKSYFVTQEIANIGTPKPSPIPSDH